METKIDLGQKQESNVDEILMLINRCDLIIRSGLISDECLAELKSINKELLGYVINNVNGIISFEE
jgi:hypothetical protein